jgi:hypothetical protein
MPANLTALMSELAFATPDEVLSAIDVVAQRADVAAAIRDRNGDPENELRALFREPPLPPDAGPPNYIALKPVA